MVALRLCELLLRLARARARKLEAALEVSAGQDVLLGELGAMLWAGPLPRLLLLAVRQEPYAGLPLHPALHPQFDDALQPVHHRLVGVPVLLVALLGPVQPFDPPPEDLLGLLRVVAVVPAGQLEDLLRPGDLVDSPGADSRGYGF